MFYKFSAFSLEFQKVFSIARTIFSRSPEQFFLKVGQNNFRNKISIFVIHFFMFDKNGELTKKSYDKFSFF